MSGINGAWVARLFEDDKQSPRAGAEAVRRMRAEKDADNARKIEYLRTLSGGFTDEHMTSLWRDAAKSIGVDFDKVDQEMKKVERENREREERRAEEERVKMAEAAARKKAADDAELAELKSLPNFGMF